MDPSGFFSPILSCSVLSTVRQDGRRLCARVSRTTYTTKNSRQLAVVYIETLKPLVLPTERRKNRKTWTKPSLQQQSIIKWGSRLLHGHRGKSGVQILLLLVARIINYKQNNP